MLVKGRPRLPYAVLDQLAAALDALPPAPAAPVAVVIGGDYASAPARPLSPHACLAATRCPQMFPNESCRQHRMPRRC